MGAPTREPNWCFLVTYTDRLTGLRSEERHAFERSARERAEALRRAGFWSVEVKGVRVKVNQRQRSFAVLGVDGKALRG